MAKKSIALFDIDKTIYNDHSFFGVTKYFVDHEIMPQKTWEDISLEAKKYFDKQQSYSLTAENLLNIYSSGLSGMNYDDILKATREFFTLNSDKFYPYFKEITPELKTKYDIYLVSTNSQMIAEVVKEMYDLDGYLSTQFEVVDNIFTGKILSTLANGKHIVKELVSGYEEDSLAVGDSENDISMFEQVKHPICINPSEELKNEAIKRKWVITDDKNISNVIKDLIN